jgi:signal transduction histidine kinase
MNPTVNAPAVERVSAWSLRARMLWIALAALLASLASGGLAMYWAASFEEDQAMDARLEHLGATVLAFVEEEIEEEIDEIARGLHPMPLNLKTRPSVSLLYRFQVWTRHGSLLIRNHEAPENRPLMPLDRLGYFDVRIAGERHRAFALPTSNGEFVVQVAENVEERWTQTATITLYYTAFLALPLALVFGLTWLWLHRSLHSINVLASQLGERHPQDMTPVQVPSPPRELLPILHSIDGLFARISHALSVERSFTSLAAHEIRTPLAGLRAHAQLATRARTPEEAKQALDSLLRGTDRVSHLVDQLLDLARVDSMPKDAESMFEPILVSDIYQEVMHDLGPRGERKLITLSARLPAVSIVGHRFAVHVLLRNLVANALAYTPEGGRVEVSARRDGNAVEICVDDSGPGIPPADRERALQRFNRLGRNQVDGSGLGLAIVLSVTELHRAPLVLTDSPLGGLRVSIRFVAASPAS